jgi:hypothetical protein
LASRVADERDILVFPLCSLPDLHFAAASENTYTHRRQEIVCGVGVVIDTTVEDGGSVLSDTRSDKCLSTGVILDEVAHVVDNTGNSNESAAILGFGLVGIPVDDGKLLERNTPVKCLSLLVKLLLQLLETALFDFILLELLEIVGESELLQDPDRPLSRVILMPFDSIAVVGWELVVEVVVAFSEGDESSNDVVTRRVAIVKWLVTKPMGQRVDTEGSLLDEEDAENTSVDKSTLPVSPSKTSDEAREDQAHKDNGLEVVPVLPNNDRVIIQIRNVGSPNALWVLLHNHPSEMRIKETLANGVWVLVGIGISVVSAVIS